MRVYILLPSLNLKATRDAVVLRQRYYPVLCAMWCYGIMATICVLAYVTMTRGPVYQGTSPAPVALDQGERIGLCAMAVIGFAIASLMSGWTLAASLRKPLLVFDRARQWLLVPRLNLTFRTPEKVWLGMREEEQDQGEDGGTLTGDVLYLCAGPDEPQPVKLFTEYRAGELACYLTRFAAETGVPWGEYRGPGKTGVTTAARRGQ